MRRIVGLVWIIAAVGLSACGVNPVTGKKEIQFVSEAQELQIGEQNYAPTQQGEGGQMSVLPDLTAYVNEIGQKLAAVADRKLPYEFVVLNNSVPNAWALPGGKIAVNRGLLTELQNEAELAAVLGHEIVHAAARHGAKAQERGTIMQAGMAAAQIGAAIGGLDAGLANVVLGGAGVGAQMIQQKYGRDQELESDLYGMKYMKKVGYDPWGAVTLQETFVRLSQQGGAKQESWFEGLFASHPPSQERVDKNKVTAEELGRGGELGQEQYAARMKSLRDIKPAYDKHDQAMAAASKKDFATARSLTSDAARMVPREGRFQEFLGELSLAEKKPAEAIASYQKAIELNPNYFGSYLGGGVAQYQAGDKAKAQEWLAASAKLLPTAPAAYYLGNLARDSGNRDQAMQYYRAAAGSKSQTGQLAAREFVKMDLPQNAGNYVAATGSVRFARASVRRGAESCADSAHRDPGHAGAHRRQRAHRARGLAGATEQRGETGRAGFRVFGISSVPPEQLQSLRFRVDGAQIAE